MPHADALEVPEPWSSNVSASVWLIDELERQISEINRGRRARYCVVVSEENVNIVRRCVEFWAQRDYSQMKELLDPDVVIDLSRNVFNPDIYRGYDDVRRLVEGVDEMWDEFQADLEEVVDEGARVVTGILSGVGHGSGVKTEMKVFQVWKLHDGKVVEATGGYRKLDKALEAAGLSE